MCDGGGGVTRVVGEAGAVLVAAPRTERPRGGERPVAGGYPGDLATPASGVGGGPVRVSGSGERVLGRSLGGACCRVLRETYIVGERARGGRSPMPYPIVLQWGLIYRSRVGGRERGDELEVAEVRRS